MLPRLAALSSETLTARLVELRAKERTLLVEFLAYLAEVDRRELYLSLGHSSLFAFCTDRLKLTRSAAFRRTTAARLLATFPIIADYLADGRLCLTTLVELRSVLHEERCRAVLDRAAGKTEDEVRVLVATLNPQPIPAPTIRRLPEPKADPISSGPALPLGVTVAPVDMPPAMPAPVPIERPRATARLEPITETVRLLRLAIGPEFAADLERVKAALSHKVPDGDLEKVLHECLRTTLEACERRKLGSGKARRSKSRAPGSRHIPVEVARAVTARDEGRCTFVGSDGRRCGSTHLVQFDHIVPFAQGGASTIDNVRLLCARHNRFKAKQDYGEAHMARFLRRPGHDALHLERAHDCTPVRG